MLGVAVAIREGTTDFGAGVAGWSEPFCRAMVQTFGGGDERVCPWGKSIPEGEYGQELHAALLPLATEVEPRIGIPPVLNERQTFTWLLAVQPDVERVFAELREQVEALDPPDELEADHELVLEFLDEISDVARRITAAAEERDFAELERLFVESERPGEHVRAGRRAPDRRQVLRGDVGRPGRRERFDVAQSSTTVTRASRPDGRRAWRGPQ